MVSTIFPVRINGEWSEDGETFTLDLPFFYIDLEKDIAVRVPAGFVTDFNSSPKALWWYFSKWEYPEAGVVHDWLYRSPEGFTSTSIQKSLTRAQCDDFHRRILYLKGCRWGKRQAAYVALRSMGWRPWNRYREVKTPVKFDDFLPSSPKPTIDE